MKVKTICTHCGKKQTAKTQDYSLNNVACKFCKKEGELQEQVSIDEITEIVLDMLSEGKDFEEVKKKTGVLNIEEDKSPDGETTVITIHYPDGETISHWV